ncbi:Fur family transcriptional regulator [Synechococcus elongatus]|uniref:Ferric uptake regulator, FUR family n=2 Tax=Synechococcus elongatus TaxID=32046 RepID=Q31MP1_SYNE7|nr:Fur family transcriptional regulator [Synechococcus elongatus]ABB57678.1 putative ferric uptake regulator, FUR family [Synechococcus elongatus PCC 7942 = FACHB-805]AJD57830.1 transcriptional regulator [Synechococcus elongatus UTEX 2973]MBD2586393.1 transcriptional repressor [Synechococcus elongatus FACHB-242]MBD2687467.1 transcriptional repressor [Synechococcus elongatus FACHB-1061]MBD2706824.1 transcriptional repressor [Synechococcus elongatus PCC 7942 = FACHB-805]
MSASSTPSVSIRDRLQQAGLRVTPQRFAVYANLLGRHDHPTVETILQDINQELPMASKAAVYGALSVLREVGLIREVLLDEGITRYDARTEPHHHCRCESCGGIQDLDWTAIAPIDLSAVPAGFRPDRYEVTILGQCAACATSIRKPKN